MSGKPTVSLGDIQLTSGMDGKTPILFVSRPLRKRCPNDLLRVLMLSLDSSQQLVAPGGQCELICEVNPRARTRYLLFRVPTKVALTDKEAKQIGYALIRRGFEAAEAAHRRTTRHERRLGRTPAVLRGAQVVGARA